MGGPFGAIFGLFLGHQFDKARRLKLAGFSSDFSSGPSQSERQAEFFKSAFAVMGHVAKAKVRSHGRNPVSDNHDGTHELTR